MPDFGPHAPFVWSAYAIVFGALLLLIVATMLRYHHARRRLRRLETQLAQLESASSPSTAQSTKGETA